MTSLPLIAAALSVACARPETVAAPTAGATAARAAIPRAEPVVGPFVRLSVEPVAEPAWVPMAVPAKVDDDESATVMCTLSQGGVKTVGPHAYEVDRMFLAARLEERITLQDAGDRVIPYYSDGAYAGVRFVSVRSGGVMRALGFRSGDTLTSVNGQALESPHDALALVTALTRDTHVSLGVLRAGRRLTFAYEIR